jgi:CubicO group peptidase (beta-lactamase class C family)
MTLDTTLMAYSMTKTVTAVAVLQLVEQRRLGLDDEIDRHLADNPYGNYPITIRQLLDHTSGLPDPIPLRWAHLVEEDASFDEDAALAQVVRDNHKLAFEPGRKFAYSNIGYWLLGKIVEQATGQSYADYVRANVLRPLKLSPHEMDFVIAEPTRHAKGYLAKYSWLNLLKGFVADRKFWGEYEGNWLRVKSHHLNGPAFGGLVATARGFGRFLQDQLRTESVLLGPDTKRLVETRQTDSAGEPIPMTLGWHVGETHGLAYLFKEGGGCGFHSEMRVYPTKGLASVVMVNSTEFKSTRFLNRLDCAFFGQGNRDDRGTMHLEPGEFRARPLRVHALLHDVPLEDVWAIRLSGGGDGRTVQGAWAVMVAGLDSAPAVVRWLFRVRTRIGALLGWDQRRAAWDAESYTNRLSPADRARSQVVPGTPDGAFRLLYRFEDEQLSELRNSTVHAFVSLSIRPMPGGYLAYLGVFVRSVHRFTGLYMMAIAPFRRLVIYPAVIRKMQRAWAERYGGEGRNASGRPDRRRPR